jgi:microcystin-dependent protein
MPYTITKSDGTPLAVVQDGTADHTTALTLPGPNFVGYGFNLNENLVHLLENFAANTTPSGISLEGQLYFDKYNQILKVYTTQGYVPVSGVTNSGTQPAISKDGDIWFNTTTNQMSLWDNGQFKLIGPQYTKAQGISGAIPVTVNDGSTSGVVHNILKLQFGNRILATISSEPTFIPSGFDPGFPRVYPGITFNSNIAGTTTNTNVIGNLTGNVVAGTVVSTTLIGNVSATTLSGTLTGNVFGTLIGTVNGNVFGNVAATNTQSTNFSSGNATITGGSLTGISSITSVAAQINNFSSANAIITGGTVSLNTLTVTTGQFANVVTANAQITGGSISGVASITTPRIVVANLSATTGQLAQILTANAQVTGGDINGLSTFSATAVTATNLTTGNAQITGGSLQNLTSVVATSLTATNLTTGNITITSGNVSGVTGVNNVFTSAVLNNSAAPTANISNKSTTLATTQYVHNVMPIGAIIMFGGTTIPYGWHICDGNNGTPDLRDRFVIGAGDTYTLASTGGNTTVTLSSNQMPAHLHNINSITATTNPAGAHTHTATSVSTVTDPGHSHSITQQQPVGASAPGSTGQVGVNTGASTQGAFTGIGVSTATSIATVDTHYHTVTVGGNTAITGGTSSIDITPTYYALYYIQKII